MTASHAAISHSTSNSFPKLRHGGGGGISWQDLNLDPLEAIKLWRGADWGLMYAEWQELLMHWEKQSDRE